MPHSPTPQDCQTEGHRFTVVGIRQIHEAEESPIVVCDRCGTAWHCCIAARPGQPAPPHTWMAKEDAEHQGLTCPCQCTGGPGSCTTEHIPT